VGKTACLVHIATDQLFQKKHVIHVSFATNTGHIVAWYEDIFNEIAKRYKLDSTMEIHDDLTRHRVIMNFRQDGIQISQILKSINSMIRDGNFSADSVIVDGYDFSRSNPEELNMFKKFAENLDVELWFSASIRPGETGMDENGVPNLLSPFIKDISILIYLEPQEEYIHLNLVKDHEITQVPDLHLKLDPKILLIAEEK